MGQKKHEKEMELEEEKKDRVYQLAFATVDQVSSSSNRDSFRIRGVRKIVPPKLNVQVTENESTVARKKLSSCPSVKNNFHRRVETEVDQIRTEDSFDTQRYKDMVGESPHVKEDKEQAFTFKENNDIRDSNKYIKSVQDPNTVKINKTKPPKFKVSMPNSNATSMKISSEKI